MTDKVQKIREEVEIVVNRRLNLLNGDYFNLNEETDGLTNEIMDIIDSLQEEHVNYDKLNTMLDDALAKETKESLNERLGISQEEYGKIVDECIYGKEPELVDDGDLPKVEPVSNDFEMALAEMIDKAQTSVVEPLVIAAQWKDELIKLAKDKELVSEDLEEAANFYADTHTEWFDADNNPHVSPAFKAGANWQKEQMMAKAIDATIEEPEPLLWRVLGELEGLFVAENNLHDGDGVKVIIVNED